VKFIESEYLNMRSLRRRIDTSITSISEGWRQLDRRCTVLIPDRDPLLLNASKRLGFDKIQLLQDNDRTVSGRGTVTPSPSKANVREVGFIVRCSTATLWNEVDTIIDGEIARDRADQFGPFEAILSPWQRLLEAEVLTNSITSFSYSTYFQMLSNVRAVRPQAVIPSACGCKYVGDGQWLNEFVFPATREMFLRDVSAFRTGMQAMAANPGDVADVQRGGAPLHKGASPFVRMVEDDVAHTAVDPTGSVSELADSSPGDYSHTGMLGEIETFLSHRIAYEYQPIGLVYQLDVIFPTGVRSRSIRFGADLSLRNEPSAVAHILSRITASALRDLRAGRRSLNYVYGTGLYRSSQRIYICGPQDRCTWAPAPERYSVDPLGIARDPEALFERYIDREFQSLGV
jgi:hypothetical protein